MAARIDVTHVGSLPRGDELTPLLLAKDHGEPYDADEFDRIVQAPSTTRWRDRSRPACRSSATASSARSAIRPTSSSGSKASAAIVDRKPALDLARASRPAQEARRDHGVAGIHPRLVHRARSGCERSSRLPTTSAASAPRSTGRERRAGVHERGLAGPDHRLPAQRYYPSARGLSRRPRRGDAARI